MNLSWLKTENDSSLKYVFHIADAGPHTDKSLGIGSESSCACGKLLKPILNELNLKNIHYHLVKVKDYNDLLQMEEAFKKNIKHFMSVNIKQVEKTKENIVNTIIAKMINENDS